MAGFRNYEVTVPPTSDEVEALALDAIRNHRLLNITAVPEPTDIGPSDAIDLAVKIKATRHPEAGGMRIIGETALGETVNLEISSQPVEPATLSMWFDFNH